MEYRLLGNTGISVSEIGLGCEGFIGKDEKYAEEMMDIAIKSGINCMDIYSPKPELRSMIGRTLEGRRQNFILQSHICTAWRDGQYKATRDLEEVREFFEDSLTRFNTDYIDIGMIHYVDSVDEWDKIANGDVMKFALEQKQLGRIRHIGISSHNPEAAMKAVQSGLIEVLMFSVNPCYDLQPASEDCEDLWKSESYEGSLVNMDPTREKLYETCQSAGVGITVMKAFGGGDLLSDLSPAGKALTPCQCLHYALTRPAVASVMAGAHSIEELNSSLSYVSAGAEERDYAKAFEAFPKISWQGHCMYCGHCAPCPVGIDVSSVTKFLNLCSAQECIPETVREHYESLTHHAGECLGCALCEERCPFGVSVIKNMQKAENLFGK